MTSLYPPLSLRVVIPPTLQFPDSPKPANGRSSLALWANLPLPSTDTLSLCPLRNMRCIITFGDTHTCILFTVTTARRHRRIYLVAYRLRKTTISPGIDRPRPLRSGPGFFALGPLANDHHPALILRCPHKAHHRPGGQPQTTRWFHPASPAPPT